MVTVVLIDRANDNITCDIKRENSLILAIIIYLKGEMRMNKYRFEREIPIEDGYDLVVAGGGPAGTAAAVCAARLGAKVLLVEATGCLGGMGTNALVAAFDPMADGEKMLVGGYMRELVEDLYVRGYLQPGIDPDTWRKHYYRWTPFSTEGLKVVLDEYAQCTGVEVRFFTRVVDCELTAPEQISGVILHNIEGFKMVKASCFIDATGDGVLAKLSGVVVREAGNDTRDIMPATLPSIYSGINWQEGKAFDEQSQEGVKNLEEAYGKGIFTQCDRHLPGMSRIGNTLGYLNGGHLFGVNALHCKDLSDGMMLGRKIAREYMNYYREYMPAFADMELVSTGSVIGVRESRRIVGEYELVFDDYMARRQFPDQIGVFNKFVDIHPTDTDKETWLRFRDQAFRDARIGKGECFGLPYGILVPKGFKNLWVAGRCCSCDVMVHGSIRVMPAAAMMGQAAGTAAVQVLHTGETASTLNTEILIKTLREQGAYLPQAETSTEMTRT